MSRLIQLYAGDRSDGTAVKEEVVVEPLGGPRFKLVQSPGLVLGVAAGDVLDVADDGKFKVVERAGNVCIQIFATAHIEELEDEMTRALRKLGGRLDGKSSKELVYTVHVSAGFPAIEGVLQRCANFPTSEWYYGNVYDPADGVTPLNWW